KGTHASVTSNSIPAPQRLTKSRIPRPIFTPATTQTATNRVAKRKHSAIAEPWRSVVEQLFKKIKGGDVALAEEWPKKLTGLHEALYKFIQSQIQGSKPMSQQAEKDVFVAMSGIANARMSGARHVFGDDTVDQIKTLCLRPGISDPSDQLLAILEPLQEAFVGGMERLRDVVEAAIGVEASARLRGLVTNPLKQRVLDVVRHLCINKPSKAMSEGELVAVWSYILNALADHKLTLRSGELTSKATRWQQLLMQQEYDLDAGSATYGRKLDLQCRHNDVEINNSEFKVDHASDLQVEVQYRKNLRVNQAMMLYLNEQINMSLEDMEVLALDVHGCIILGMLKFGISVAGIALPALSQLVSTDTIDQAKGICGEGDTVDGINMMENNEALEGADLRKLDTFLENKDENKVMQDCYDQGTRQMIITARTTRQRQPKPFVIRLIQ
ncbi:hypothetical protein BGZ65_006571, partial [Modicella reniformis]